MLFLFAGFPAYSRGTGRDKEAGMVFSNLILATIIVLAAGAVVFGLTVALRTYVKYRGERVITCPETHQAAAVHVNATNAARDALFGKTNVRLDQCSRWPERQNCGQECLSQVNADPAQCLVWNMVDQWYKGKSCAYCQKPFTEIHWHDRHPALLAPDHTCNGMKWLRKDCRRFSSRTCRCAGTATSRRHSGGRIPRRFWTGHGSAARAASMFQKKNRRLRRKI
jgi:hypothetical protein